MSKEELLVTRVLTARGVNISEISEKIISLFAQNQTHATSQIALIEENIMKDWKIHKLLMEVAEAHLFVANGTVNQEYVFEFDKSTLASLGIGDFTIDVPQELGLHYENSRRHMLTGKPTKHGEFELEMKFRLDAEAGEELKHSKKLKLFINPDPKSLWKNIPSDKEMVFWKEDDSVTTRKLGERNLVVCSSRGRAHENVGSCRDDDYGFEFFKKTGWSLIAVADGAGSSKFSRKGSQLASVELVDYFKNSIKLGELKDIEACFENVDINDSGEIIGLPLEKKSSIINTLYKAVLKVHSSIEECAKTTFKEYPEEFKDLDESKAINYFNTTLAFTLFKKFETGYAFLTFSVGDCPAVLLDEKQKSLKLLNWLDVGEFGGGTRFVTQREIFHSKQRPVESRFSIHFQKDFSYLFLMTDGVYDPKFEVEKNLERYECWSQFLKDLDGENEEGIKVELEKGNDRVGEQLSNWMDFWSKGNHDDRTLAIIY